MAIQFALHLDRAKFPADPFGYDHAQKCAELVDQIARSMGATDYEVKIVRAAAILHDIGRREMAFWLPDTGHGTRGAALADNILQQDTNWRDDRDARERVLRLIARHTIHGERPTDPLAIALHDADILECARHAPGEPRGIALVRQLYPRLISGWANARDADGALVVQERWIAKRSQVEVEGAPILNQPLSATQVKAVLGR